MSQRWCWRRRSWFPPSQQTPATPSLRVREYLGGSVQAGGWAVRSFLERDSGGGRVRSQLLRVPVQLRAPLPPVQLCGACRAHVVQPSCRRHTELTCLGCDACPESACASSFRRILCVFAQAGSSATTRTLPLPSTAATNLQHEIDRGVQRVVEAVAAAQSVAGSGAPGVVTFEATGGSSGALPPLDVYRPVSCPLALDCSGVGVYFTPRSMKQVRAESNN